MANTTADPAIAPLHQYVGEYIPDSSRIAFIFVGTAMILSALIGNTTLIAIILKHFMRNKKKRLHDLFIANLAFNDLITLCYWHLLFVLDLILGYYPAVNNAHCVITGLICCMTFVVNITALLSISFNRYLHVCHSHLYNRVFTLTRTVIWCILIWVVSFIHAIPPLWGGYAGNYHYNSRAHICSYNRAGDTYVKTLFMVYSLAPMVVIAYFNVAIFRFWRNARMSLNKRFPMAKKDKKDKQTVKWKAALFSKNKKLIPGSLDDGTGVDKTAIGHSDDEDACDPANAAERSDTSVTSTTEEKSGTRSGEYNRYFVPKVDRGGLMFRGLKSDFSSTSHSYSHTEDTETCTDTEDTTTLASTEDKTFLDNFFKSNRGRPSTKGRDPTATPRSLQRIAASKHFHKPSEDSQQKRRKKSRSREVAFVRSLMVVCILMLIIFVPYTITVFMESPTTPPELAMFGICLLFSNNSINWIIYGLMNPSFKKSYVLIARWIFCRLCDRRRRPRHAPESIMEDGFVVKTDKPRELHKPELPDSLTDKHTDTDRNTDRQTE